MEVGTGEEVNQDLGRCRKNQELGTWITREDDLRYEGMRYRMSYASAMCVRVYAISQHYVESERPSSEELHKIESKYDPVIDHGVHRPRMSIACYKGLIITRSQTDGATFPALRV